MDRLVKTRGQRQRQTSGAPHVRFDAPANGESVVREAGTGGSYGGRPRLRDTEVIAPNFKQRLSGVTSTIIQLVPLMRKLGLGISAFGPGLPDSLSRVHFWQLPGLLRRPASGSVRVWHARRNPEMVGGLILRYIFRAPMKLLFTSASQRKHKGFTKWLIRRMDAVVATSRKTAAYLEVPNTVIMHGIDTARFCPVSDQAPAKQTLGLDPTRKIAGCFGRIRHQKGTDLFVDSMIRLLPERPDWIGIIAGRTTAEHKGFEKELRDRIDAAGLGDRILFVGEHTAIEEWYQILSLFVAPQRWEGFGLTPLEAMACGVPVVASDVCAFSELIVEGKTGAVIDADNLDKMVAASTVYLDDTSFREASGNTALEHVRENFPLEREAENLIAVYRRLMSNI
jgi:mannosyltransferase